MIKRILITGPSGMGKTTLANKLSEHYNIPKVGVSIMDNICKCYSKKLKTHQDLIDYMAENPLKGMMMQSELLAARQILFGNHYQTGFVTDRGHIDSLVYTYHQVLRYLPEQEYQKAHDFLVKKSVSIHRLFTHIVYLPYREGFELEDNGVRITNPEVQLKYTQLFDDVILKITGSKPYKDAIFSSNNGYLPYIKVVEQDNFEKRFDEVTKFINEYA